jgi:hypothetical protein
VVKERAMEIVQTLQYEAIPKKMKIEIIQYVVYWLSIIPKTDQNNSPRDSIFGEQKLDYKSICQLPFGAYVQELMIKT